MTETTSQTIMVAAFCATGGYRGDWIATIRADGKLSFMSTLRRHDETEAQAAARCVKEQLWPDSPLEEHNFGLASIGADEDGTKIFRAHWLLPLEELNLTEFAMSNNRTDNAPTTGMTTESLRALAKAPALIKHMRGTRTKVHLDA